MLEDALKNMFPYRELSLSIGDGLSINGKFYYVQEGVINGTFGNKVPINFECSENGVFGLRQLMDINFEIKTLSVKKNAKLLSFDHDNFTKMLENTDKNVVIFLKSLIQHGTF